MNLFGLGHMDVAPVIYGVLFYIAAMLIIVDVISMSFMNILRATCVCLFIYIGFAMHGEAYTGRMAVAIGALLFHVTFPVLVWFVKRS